MDIIENYLNDLSNIVFFMTVKDFKDLRKNTLVQGKPSNNLKARHSCFLCKKKKYEFKMVCTDRVKVNNFKAWFLWKCKNCHEKKKGGSSDEFFLY